MRAAFVVLSCIISVSGSVFGDQVQFPYELTVANGPVDVRSGPGQQYYTTDQLPAGAKIQVYRHDSDWLAIRPPEGSFSLVNSDQLKATNQAGVAKATKDDVRCHVGSNVEQISEHVSWVRLRKNELVELINGEKSTIKATVGSAQGVWHRIAPPAGEFRWVSAADVRKKTVTPAAATKGSDREAIRIPTDARQEPVIGGQSKEKTGEPTAAGRGENGQTRDSSDDKWVARSASLPDDLAEIELAFSLMVAKEMRAWRLEQVRDRVETVMKDLHNGDDLSRARTLLKRIGEFEQLQNRFVQTMGDSYIPDARRPAISATDTASTAVERATGVRYDGSGWLFPVHSTKQTAPPYALLDAEGDVLHYVSPTPGLNLHRYMRKQVGIFGHRGYQQSLKKPHLTAERVVDLGRHLR